MVAFESLGFVVGASLLLQNALQGECSPLLLSRRAAAPPPHQPPANLTALLNSSAVNESQRHGVELEITPFALHVSFIDPSKFDDFMEVAVTEIKDDIQTHGEDSPTVGGRWDVATSGVAVLFVKDVHYTGQLTYGMIDGALTELIYIFALYDYRESNLRVFEDWGRNRLVARGYVAKTVRGPPGSSLVNPGDASTESVDVTR